MSLPSHWTSIVCSSLTNSATCSISHTHALLGMLSYITYQITHTLLGWLHILFPCSTVLGCYGDGTARDISGSIQQLANNTLANCRDFCKNQVRLSVIENYSSSFSPHLLVQSSQFIDKLMLITCTSGDFLYSDKALTFYRCHEDDESLQESITIPITMFSLSAVKEY